MGRYRGPKNKLARKEGQDLSLKTSGSGAHTSLLRRIKIQPGQHGQKRHKKLSDYGRQLREKQKAKHIYGIMEKQFKRYYEYAAELSGVTGEALLQQLEGRLDNVVYRLGFAPTRTASRQFVRHGHVKVNDRTVTIPSYQVAIDDIISLRSKSLAIPTIAKSLSEAVQQAPTWLKKKAAVGKVLSLPKREEIQEDINEQLIVEYYSR